MDESLRCNSLPCRKVLQTEGRAVSTTCSHLFCYDCATRLLKDRHICPVCDTALENQEDVIVKSLNPTAAWRNTVLAGLSPHIIMEICSRAIAFYQYQSTNEAAYQSMLLHKAQEALAVLERELERVTLSAKTELRHQDAKIGDLERQLDNEKRKSREMNDMLRTSGRDYEQLKTQFDQSKRDAVRHDLARATPASRTSDAGVLHGHSSSSMPQPFFSAGPEASAPTSRAFYSPRPLSSMRPGSDTEALWATPSRNLRESIDSARDPSRSSHRTSQQPAHSSAQPPSYINGRLSVPPPAYRVPPSRMSSRTPIVGTEEVRLRSSATLTTCAQLDPRQVQSPIRAMPMPPQGRGASARPNGVDKILQRDGGTSYDRMMQRGAR